MFRRGKGRAESREIDEHLVVTEGETRRLRNDFVDHNRKDLSFWMRKHEGFAEREARVLYRRERELWTMTEERSRFGATPPERKRWLKENVYLRFPLFVCAFLYFIYRYVVRLGFLDGKEGLVVHVLQGFWYWFYVDAKLTEMRGGALDSEP